MRVEPAGDSHWKFWCPGCGDAHVVSSAWEVDVESATISPSVLVHSVRRFVDSDLVGDALMAPGNATVSPLCHSFVRGGRIEFLGDSTHSLAGQTVDLPEWPADL